MKLSKTLICCSLLFSSTQGFTAEETAALTVDQATKLALTHNRSIQASQHEAVAHRFQASQIRGAYLPQITAYASGTQASGLNNPFWVSSNADSDEADTIYTAGLQVKQFLYGFGIRHAALAGGQAQVALGTAFEQQTETAVSLATRNAFAAVQFAQARLRIAVAQKEIREKEWQDAQLLLKAGRITRIDERQAFLLYTDAQQAESEAETHIRTQFMALARLIEQPYDTLVIEAPLTRPEQLQELIQHASSRYSINSQIAALTAQEQQQQATVDGLAAQNLPVLAAVGAYQQSGLEIDDLSEGWSAGLELSWTFDGGSRSAAKHAAEEQLHSAQKRNLYAQDHLLTRISQLQAEAAMLERNIKRQIQSVQLATENYTDSASQYREGRITITRLSEANLAIFNARYRLAEFIYREVLIANELLSIAE